MVAETSEASKDQQSESATGENSTCRCRICNLISAEKATFQREKCLASYKSNGQCLAYVHPIREVATDLEMLSAAPRASLTLPSGRSQLSACIPNWMDARYTL